VWKMRAAPENRRLVSYGQVESPWPVIGSVLVAQGKAYASAGRTTGSDAGIAIRAFDPFTGAAQWSRAFSQGDYLNDVMFEFNGLLGLLRARFDPLTGADKTDAPLQYSLLPQAEKEKKAPPEGVALDPGPQGFICGHWRKIGTRRSGGVRIDNVQGTLVAWDGQTVCQVAGNGNGVSALKREPGKCSGVWGYNCPGGYQITAVVLASNAVVIGGGLYPKDSTASRGFIQVLSRNGGQKLAEITFDAPLAYEGVAVAGGKIYATFADGSVACLGDSQPAAANGHRASL